MSGEYTNSHVERRARGRMQPVRSWKVRCLARARERDRKDGVDVPGGALEEVVALTVHELAAEPRHLVLHLPHLGVEALAYVGELGVDHAEVTEFDGNVALDTTVGHVFAQAALSCLLSTGITWRGLARSVETQFDREYRQSVYWHSSRACRTSRLVAV